jgi:hypothetical protein
MLSKASSNSTQLGTAFSDEAPVNLFLVQPDQKLDLVLQFDQVTIVSYCVRRLTRCAAPP